MRTYNGEIERVKPKENEGKFRRFAFNAMKKAKEGLMIVTVSAVMATGFTSNVYGDENMANGTKTIEEKTTTTPKSKMGEKIATPINIQKEEQLKIMQMNVTNGFRIMNDKIACSEQGVCMLPEAQTQLLDYFKTKNIKGEEVITGITLSGKIRENKYLKEKVGPLKVNEIAGIVLLKFGEVPVKEINFEEISEKNVLLLYAAHFASYNENSGFIERQNILNNRKIHKDKMIIKLDELFTNAAYMNKEGNPGAFQTIEAKLITETILPGYLAQVVNYNENIKLDDTSIKTINDFDNEGISYETKKENGKTVWYVNTKDFKNYVDKKFNEGNRHDLLEKIEGNPNNVEKLMENYDKNNTSDALSNEDRITLEKYAEMLKGLKDIYNKRDIGLGLTISGQIYDFGNTKTGYYLGYNPKLSLLNGLEVDPILIYGGLSLKHYVENGKNYITTTVGFQTQGAKENTIATGSLGYGYEGDILTPYIAVTGTIGKGESVIYSSGVDLGLKITPENNIIDFNANTTYGQKENTSYLMTSGKISYLYDFKSVEFGLFAKGGYNRYNYLGIVNETYLLEGGLILNVPINEWINLGITATYTEERGIK